MNDYSGYRRPDPKVKRKFDSLDVVLLCILSFITGLIVHAIYIGATP